MKYVCHRFEEGVSYSTMNLAKSAISKFHCFLPGNVPVGSDQLVQKAMKSFFKQRPPLPKYQNTFDVTMVMRYGKAHLKKNIFGPQGQVALPPPPPHPLSPPLTD